MPRYSSLNNTYYSPLPTIIAVETLGLVIERKPYHDTLNNVHKSCEVKSRRSNVEKRKKIAETFFMRDFS